MLFAAATFVVGFRRLAKRRHRLRLALERICVLDRSAIRSNKTVAAYAFNASARVSRSPR